MATPPVTVVTLPAGVWTKVDGTIKTCYLWQGLGEQDCYYMTIRDVGGAAPASPANDNEKVVLNEVMPQLFNSGTNGADLYMMSSAGVGPVILWKIS